MLLLVITFCHTCAFKENRKFGSLVIYESESNSKKLYSLFSFRQCQGKLRKMNWLHNMNRIWIKIEFEFPMPKYSMQKLKYEFEFSD